MARDDFTQKTKDILAKRVAFLCSNPNCQAPTLAPHTIKNKHISVGVASHITSAAPGGPRYNPNLSSEERMHENNGIWLCQSCSRLIDTALSYNLVF